MFFLLRAVAGLFGFRLIHSQIITDLYRDRLLSLGRDYDQVRGSYNEAVRKTAVTELIVQNGTICVAIQTADGAERVIQTPFDPSHEVYVDYLVANGRLWIRRVFDEQTPPDKGLVIDPTWTDIN